MIQIHWIRIRILVQFIQRVEGWFTVQRFILHPYPPLPCQVPQIGYKMSPLPAIRYTVIHCYHECFQNYSVYSCRLGDRQWHGSDRPAVFSGLAPTLRPACIWPTLTRLEHGLMFDSLSHGNRGFGRKARRTNIMHVIKCSCHWY
jgi:hypothetical protein